VPKKPARTQRCRRAHYHQAGTRGVRHWPSNTPVAPTHAMSVVHANQDAAARWLLERRDLAERRETIGMIMNAALLAFIALEHLVGCHQFVPRAPLSGPPRRCSRPPPPSLGEGRRTKPSLLALKAAVWTAITACRRANRYGQKPGRARLCVWRPRVRFRVCVTLARAWRTMLSWTEHCALLRNAGS
jgi:hypothetical protein